jgi:hypothetical protein
MVFEYFMEHANAVLKMAYAANQLSNRLVIQQNFISKFEHFQMEQKTRDTFNDQQ